MKFRLKSVFFAAAVFVVGLVAGCGGGGGGTTAAGGATPSSSGAPSGAPAAVQSDAAVLYSANCADCHGELSVSDKKNITAARLQNAIVNNIGGMGFLSTLTAAEQQTIVSALTPATPPPAATDGVALYAANCAGCHGALASSTKKGITLARLQNSITGNVGNMGFLSTLTSTQQQAIVTALAPATTPPPAPTADGAALYTANCASCHGALATSAKKGATAAQIGLRMAAAPYSTRTLTAAEIQAIAGVLAATTPPPVTPPTTTVDGAALYSANCASCHGPLATSAKKNATAAQIGVRMAAAPYTTRTLTAAEIQAIAGVLVSTTPPPVTPPSATCGSCHAIPPATGTHSFHSGRNIGCATCHGSGFSSTTVNSATHNNGVKNLTTTIGWNTTSRSCSNSCHGRKTW